MGRNDNCDVDQQQNEQIVRNYERKPKDPSGAVKERMRMGERDCRVCVCVCWRRGGGRPARLSSNREEDEVKFVLFEEGNIGQGLVLGIIWLLLLLLVWFLFMVKGVVVGSEIW